jgi:zinc transport system ATP-binding protein
MLIEVTDASFGYGNRPVVRVEQLRLHAGRCLGVFGPNGAGKTTLVRGVTGLIKPIRGSVRRAAQLRCGYLPQHRTMDVHWCMTGSDAASLAVSASKRFGWIGRDTSRVRGAMKLMGVDDLAHRPFAKLSGGQQQRLLLAGALAAEPQILVLDEPTDGLDVDSRDALLDNLRQAKSGGLCTAVISHDVEDLLKLSDEIAWLHLANEPDHPSTIELISPHDLARRVTEIR